MALCNPPRLYQSYNRLTPPIDLVDPLDPRQNRVSLLPVSHHLYRTSGPDNHQSLQSYWVISVVPYLLFCFVMEHSQVICEQLYHVSYHCLDVSSSLHHWALRSQSRSHCGTKSAPKARTFFAFFLQRVLINHFHHPVVLLIRTYAFFNRSIFVLCFLVAAMAGVVAYQLYVATSQMQCSYLPIISPFPIYANRRWVQCFRSSNRPLYVPRVFLFGDVSADLLWIGSGTLFPSLEAAFQTSSR